MCIFVRDRISAVCVVLCCAAAPPAHHARPPLPSIQCPLQLKLPQPLNSVYGHLNQGLSLFHVMCSDSALGYEHGHELALTKPFCGIFNKQKQEALLGSLVL